MDDLQIFIEELAHGLGPDERLNASAFVGDPHSSKKFVPFGVFKKNGKWIVPGNDAYNRYITVSAFKANADGEWRRQKHLFSAACAMMIDDIGDDDGAGVKLPKSVTGGLRPTFIIETSRGNYQYWYLFKEPFRDAARFERLIDGFIEKRCGGLDSGFRDSTRVGRTPCSTNTKKEKGDWKVRVVEHWPEARYSVEDLALYWDIDMTPRYVKPRIVTDAACEARIYNFELLLHHLNLIGLTRPGRPGLKKNGRLDYSDFNHSGWMEIRCPWIDNHTARADNGSAIQMPTEGNGFLGGFQCHHSSCKDEHNLSSLMKFVKEDMSDEWDEFIEKQLNEANERAASRRS